MITFKAGSRRPDWNASTTLNGKYCLAEVLSAVIKEIRRGDREAAVYWAYQMFTADQVAAEFLWESLVTCALEDVGLAEPNAINVVMSAKKFYEELPTGYIGGHLAVTFVVAYLVGCPKSRLTDEMLFDLMQQLEEEGPTREIPDYALDHHTKRGREMGRDERFFFEEASRLNNERLFTHKYRDRIMQRVKKD